MKLFTSDYAVYKRDWGEGGASQASGGLGNVLSAPACSQADTIGITQASRGSSSQLWSMGRREQRWLWLRGVRLAPPCPLAAVFEVQQC